MALVLLAMGAEVQAQSNQKLLSILEGRNQHRKFLTLVTNAGLTALLDGPGPFTIFAPTDAAYGNLPTVNGSDDATTYAISNRVAALFGSSDSNSVRREVLYHVASGNLTAAALGGLLKVTMNEGGKVNVTKPGGNLRVNHAGVSQSDIVASNGRIHILDSALVSPALGATMKIGRAHV